MLCSHISFFSPVFQHGFLYPLSLSLSLLTYTCTVPAHTTLRSLGRSSPEHLHANPDPSSTLIIASLPTYTLSSRYCAHLSHMSVIRTVKETHAAPEDIELESVYRERFQHSSFRPYLLTCCRDFCCTVAVEQNSRTLSLNAQRSSSTRYIHLPLYITL